MSDVHGGHGLRGIAPKIAVGAALAALLTSAAAVLVVTSRGGATPAARSGPAAATASDRRIAADDLIKLRRDAVEKVSDGGKVIGVKVTDADVRATLGLDPGDVITAIGGRAIAREVDVYDAVLGMSLMNASIAYVEVVHAGKPALLRWRLDGDLRAARGADTASRPGDPPPMPVGIVGSGSTD